MNDPIPSPAPPHWFARFKNWWSAHHEHLISIEDTPHSIALGSAIGIFFGFTPLWSMKTLLSIGVAWLCKCNKIAAAIAVTLHDVILPLMPAIYFWQYRIGMRVLHGRPEQRAAFHRLSFHELMTWPGFVRVGWPLLLGSLFLAIPSAVATYSIMRLLVSRARSESPSARTN